jgi:hypothetical protein
MRTAFKTELFEQSKGNFIALKALIEAEVLEDNTSAFDLFESLGIEEMTEATLNLVTNTLLQEYQNE